MLSVVDVCKSFVRGKLRRRTIPVLRNVSLQIPKGGTLGLMGASGSGKSTLARIILGLSRADSGQILFEERDVTRLSGTERTALRRKMQIAFQNPESALNPRMTIRQNLLEPMLIHNIYSPSERRTRLADKLQMVGISEKLLERYPREVSGGEAQRIMLARTLTLNPSFLVLDEPTSMLDMSVQAQILTLLKQIQRELGLTCLLISHDPDIVRWFSDQTCELKDGVLKNVIYT